jgi:hypothetical protein
MVNLDMVGRLRPDKDTGKDRLIVEGTGTAQTFDALIDQINRKYDFKLQKKPGGVGPSDHASFYLKNIPVLFLWTDTHPDYHRPSDTADRINVPGLRRITDLSEELIAHLASVPERPHYVQVARTPPGSSGFRGPTLGIMPNYGEEEEGVVIGGVSPGRPAAKAGLKEGDRIVEISGKPVKNIEAYTALLAGHKAGETIEVSFVRGGQKLTVKVLLEAPQRSPVRPD